MNTILIIELLLILNVHIFHVTNAAPLDDVCNRALNKTFCFNNFGSNPRTKTASLLTLAQIAISLAILKGAEADSRIQALMQSTTNPQLKALYVQCHNIYGATANALHLANLNINLGLQAAVISNTVEQCEGLFKSPFVSPVTLQNDIMKNLGNILGIIANDLRS